MPPPLRSLPLLLASLALGAQGPQPPPPSPYDPLLILWLLGAEVHAGTGLGLKPVDPRGPWAVGFTWNLVRYIQPDLDGTLQVSPLLERTRCWVNREAPPGPGSRRFQADLSGTTVGLEVRYYLPFTQSLWERKVNWFLAATAGRFDWELGGEGPRLGSTPRTEGRDRAFSLGGGFTWHRQVSVSLKARRAGFLDLGQREQAPWLALQVHLWLLPPRK